MILMSPFNDLNSEFVLISMQTAAALGDCYCLLVIPLAPDRLSRHSVGTFHYFSAKKMTLRNGAFLETDPFPQRCLTATNLRYKAKWRFSEPERGK